MWNLISMLPILRFTGPMTRSIVILEVPCIVTKMYSYHWPNIGSLGYTWRSVRKSRNPECKQKEAHIMM
jgi:hypothetical protein